MPDDMVKEEHDVIDNPEVKMIFPDISVVKQEIVKPEIEEQSSLYEDPSSCKSYIEITIEELTRSPKREVIDNFNQDYINFIKLNNEVDLGTSVIDDEQDVKVPGLVDSTPMADIPDFTDSGSRCSLKKSEQLTQTYTRARRERFKMASTMTLAREQQSERQQRQLIAELIDLYKDSPCLWDLASDSYKDGRLKRTAWKILLNKYKEIEPEANEASVKKKIDSLKYGYQREAKKVKESMKRSGSGTDEVHKPNLWYYELMTFLEKKRDATHNGVEPLNIENEDDRPQAAKKSKLKDQERKKEKMPETAQHSKLQTDTRVNYFGKYVGEKLDDIEGEQKDLAEKLISEVLLFAKLNKLSLETKIYTPTQSINHSIHNPYSASYLSPTIHSSQAIQSPPALQDPLSSHQPHHAPIITSRSPTINQSPPLFIEISRPSSTHQAASIPFHSSPLNQAPSSSEPQSRDTVVLEAPAEEILRDLLILKK